MDGVKQQYKPYGSCACPSLPQHARRRPRSEHGKRRGGSLRGVYAPQPPTLRRREGRPRGANLSSARPLAGPCVVSTSVVLSNCQHASCCRSYVSRIRRPDHCQAVMSAQAPSQAAAAANAEAWRQYYAAQAAGHSQQTTAQTTAQPTDAASVEANRRAWEAYYAHQRQMGQPAGAPHYAGAHGHHQAAAANAEAWRQYYAAQGAAVPGAQTG